MVSEVFITHTNSALFNISSSSFECTLSESDEFETPRLPLNLVTVYLALMPLSSTDHTHHTPLVTTAR
jgi:hypothetical protein